ncbi:MAG: hypothetical protein ITG02_01030 [Patulibacter sp.]|nr:hypothetical protein [Patulibacter sp.]
MKTVELEPLGIEPRERAALLWDTPSLIVGDAGERQWYKVLRLDLVRIGAQIEGDVVSAAAFVALAVLGDDSELADRRRKLRSHGRVGRIFDACLGTVFDLDDRDLGLERLRELAAFVQQISDGDLRARLQLRTASWARARGDLELQAELLDGAVQQTNGATRLGIVARRAAAGAGLPVAEDFNPFEATGTPDDPLLSLPWVKDLALEAAAGLAKQRLESQLRGEWDTTFSFGRTKLDDLEAAYLQAEWCGASGVLAAVERLMTSEVLGSPGKKHADALTRWALKTWTKQGGKHAFSAFQRFERSYGPAEAAETLDEIERDPEASWDRFIGAALGLWDLLTEERAAELLRTTVELLGSDREPPAVALVGNLFWRLPDVWTELATAAKEERRTWMLESLSPSMADAFTPELCRLIVEDGSSNPSVRYVVQIKEAGHVPEFAHELPYTDLLELLRWQGNSVPTEVVKHAVDRLLEISEEGLEEVEKGIVGFGPADTRRFLGDLAAYLPDVHAGAVANLIKVVRSNTVPARWQLGALEGLAALHHAGRLPQEARVELRGVRLVAGTEMFGEGLSDFVLQAARLRALSPDLNQEDVSWLAVCARSGEPRARILALDALSYGPETIGGTRAWTIVSGLFDPSDGVVRRALSALLRLGTVPNAISDVVAARLRDLYTGGTRLMRSEVVGLVRAVDGLGLDDLVDRARADPSWRVRHSAIAPLADRPSGSRGPADPVT